MRKTILLFLTAVLCTSCAGVQVRRTKFLGAHPELTEEQKTAVTKGDVILGMNPDMVTASWGSPSEQTKEIIDGKELTDWIYARDAIDFVNIFLVQFSNGLVSQVKLLNVHKRRPVRRIGPPPMLYPRPFP